MPENNFKDIDPEMVTELLDAGTPWSVVTQIAGASRTTILKRLDEAGFVYQHRPSGRPAVLTDGLRAKALQLSQRGMPDAEIAQALHVSVSTVGTYLNTVDPDRRTNPARLACGGITVQQLLELRAQNIHPVTIAEIAGVKRSTVYYHLRRHQPKTDHPE